MFPQIRSSRAVAGLLLCICAAGPALPSAQARTRPRMSLSVELGVRSVDREGWAPLTFTNRTPAPQDLDKRMACLDGQLRTRVFTLRAGGQKIPFLLPLRKYPAAGPDDYVAVAPGEKVVAKVRLDEAFALLPGKHAYRI